MGRLGIEEDAILTVVTVVVRVGFVWGRGRVVDVDVVIVRRAAAVLVLGSVLAIAIGIPRGTIDRISVLMEENRRVEETSRDVEYICI